MQSVWSELLRDWQFNYTMPVNWRFNNTAPDIYPLPMTTPIPLGPDDDEGEPVPAAHGPGDENTGGPDTDNKLILTPHGNDLITTMMCEIALIPKSKFNRVAFNITHAQIESLAMLTDEDRAHFQLAFDGLVKSYTI